MPRYSNRGGPQGPCPSRPGARAAFAVDDTPRLGSWEFQPRRRSVTVVVPRISIGAGGSRRHVSDDRLGGDGAGRAGGRRGDVRPGQGRRGSRQGGGGSAGREGPAEV